MTGAHVVRAREPSRAGVADVAPNAALARGGPISGDLP